MWAFPLHVYESKTTMPNSRGERWKPVLLRTYRVIEAWNLDVHDVLQPTRAQKQHTDSDTLRPRATAVATILACSTQTQTTLVDKGMLSLTGGRTASGSEILETALRSVSLHFHRWGDRVAKPVWCGDTPMVKLCNPRESASKLRRTLRFQKRSSRRVRMRCERSCDSSCSSPIEARLLWRNELSPCLAALYVFRRLDAIHSMNTLATSVCCWNPKLNNAMCLPHLYLLRRCASTLHLDLMLKIDLIWRQVCWVS